MPNIRHSVALAALALLLASAIPAFATTAPPPSASKDQSAATPSPQTVPEDRATSGSSSEPLSDRLDRSGGVIHPPHGVDPGMTQAPPAVGSKSTPIIRPPGAPGGRRGLTPK